MSMHLSEPKGTRPKNRMFPIWKVSVIETATDRVIATTSAQKEPEQATRAGERLITKLREEAAKQQEARG